MADHFYGLHRWVRQPPFGGTVRLAGTGDLTPAPPASAPQASASPLSSWRLQTMLPMRLAIPLPILLPIPLQVLLRLFLLTSVLTSLLTLGGCDRKPNKPPSFPELPRPKMSSDGYRQSLLGNAILSNALLSYKVQCNEQRASIRICRIPEQVHTNREALEL